MKKENFSNLRLVLICKTTLSNKNNLLNKDFVSSFCLLRMNPFCEKGLCINDVIFHYRASEKFYEYLTQYALFPASSTLAR